MEARELRNIREARLELDPGLNVFCGANAQGKTSLLEAVGLLARGRSFRTEDLRTLIRRGSPGLTARAVVAHERRELTLEVDVAAGGRRLRLDGRAVAPRSYHGSLEVVVYSTERLRIVRGPMRERRQFIDRSAAALWPAYRQLVRDYERIVLQRNAALEAGGRDLPTWDEQLVQAGAGLRQRRSAYAGRLQQALQAGFRPRGERYEIEIEPAGAPRRPEEERELLARQVRERARDERRVRRSLAGPHRDAVALRIDGEDAGVSASSGQARSLLLALSLATLEVYRQELGTAPVALLDDLDSELDEERAYELCREVARRGQALVTTAHEGWAAAVGAAARRFLVADGRVFDAKES